jgi:centrosomal protein CEP104
MSKIPHRVVYCTSEEKDHSADELNTPSTESSGWISARFSEYPQEIGFQLIGRRPDIHLNQIQILNHQSKIATKVEVFIGSGLDYSTAIFKRLGFLSIDSNERSSYQARELKTVFVDVVGNFVKFRLQKNYLNEFNPFNQVGIVSVTFFGNENDQSLSASLPSSSVQLQSQIQHDVQPQSVSNSNHPFGINVKLDSTTLNKLKLIAEAKTKAIENEDYATAKVIKSIEVELKEMSLNLIEVDESKKSAVIAEDYDLAAELKEKGDKLRITMKQKVHSQLHKRFFFFVYSIT